MPWILFALLAPLTWAATNIVDKYILSKLTRDPWVPAVIFGLAGAVAGTLIFFFKGFPPVSPAFLAAAFLTGAIYCAAEIFYLKAVNLEEISRVISIIYIDPLFTAILAAGFLGEIFSPIKYVGVFLLVSGAIIISLKFGQGFTLKKTTWLALLSALLFSVSNLFNKLLLEHNDFWTVFAYVRVANFIVLLPIIFYKRKMLWGYAAGQTRNFLLIFFNSSLTLLGTFLFVVALSLGFATFTAAFSALQPFFVLMMTLGVGVFYPSILKEEGGRAVFLQKLLAVGLMFAGVILISPK